MNDISPDHPRAESLRYREKLAEGFEKGLVTPEGLSAHGRGETFDYILGEETTKQAKKAIRAGAAEVLLSKNPVFSVNGNVSALVPEIIARLEETMDIKIEVNLFHKSREREKKIAEHLKNNGVEKVYGADEEHSAEVPGIKSNRRIVDERGIKDADLVMVPLEDGDRTEELVDQGKKVVTIDLNPMSRTARAADVTIVDNIVRALPIFIEQLEKMKSKPANEIEEIADRFDNEKNLKEMLKLMFQRLEKLSTED